MHVELATRSSLLRSNLVASGVKRTSITEPGGPFALCRTLIRLGALATGTVIRVGGCETLGHYKLYIRLAAASARVHPTRFPCLSRRLARAKVAANAAFACCSARLIEAGVGWTIELCANRLRRHRPGVRISRGLAHRLLELRDPAAARTGMRRRDAEAKGGGNEQGCRKSADGSTAHLRASP